MKCVILTSPGEVIDGALHAMRLGYEVDLYPTTQDTSALLDSRYEESAAYLGRSPESVERSYVRSLRASFIRMLRDERYRDQEDIIFCESDVIPLISAADMKRLVEDTLATHPEADVLRPFQCCMWQQMPKGLSTLPDHASFCRMEQRADRDICTPEVWGTHALIIPARSREKVARLFAEYRLPTDVALSLANGKDELTVYTSSHNFFVQGHRSLKPRSYRIAGLLSSYKRLKDLQRQIWCMMDQDYPNFHLFVAVKGVSEADFRRVLLPQFRHFIEEGRLTMRLCPNRNQLSNLLDTVRELDVSEYDLFAKIDDDDIYARDYVSLVNRFHSMLPPGIGSHYTGKGGYFWSAKGFPSVAMGGFGLYGPTIVFPKRVLELLQSYEQNPESILPYFCEKDRTYLRSCFSVREDALLDFINRRCGACNRASFIDVQRRGLSLLISQDNPSVLRGGYIEPDMGESLRSTTPSSKGDEHLLFLVHPHWSSPVRLLGNRVRMLTKDEYATVLAFDGSSLRLKWDNWGEELFVMDDSGSFMLAQP